MLNFLKLFVHAYSKFSKAADLLRTSWRSDQERALHRLFARGEMIALFKEALASGPKTTKELALHVMGRKGLDTGDKVLAHAMAQRMIHALRMPHKRGAASLTRESERRSRLAVGWGINVNGHLQESKK